MTVSTGIRRMFIFLGVATLLITVAAFTMTFYSPRTAGEERANNASEDTVEEISTNETGQEVNGAEVRMRPDLFSTMVGADAALGEAPYASTVEELLEKGLDEAEVSPTHIAIRGTAVTDSTRCSWRGIARTLAQREEALRFWLDLESTESLPTTDEAYESLFQDLIESNAVYPTTLVSNVRSLAYGGLTGEYLYLTCFADFTILEHLLGTATGTTNITVAYDRMMEERSYALYLRAHETGELGDSSRMTEAEYQNYLLEMKQFWESYLSVVLKGEGGVLFLAPMGAHNTIAVEAWQGIAQWGLEEVEETNNQGNTVTTTYAVRYGAAVYDPEYRQTLATLRSRITAAAASDAHADNRIANISGLEAYYREIGAYGDITPDDGSTATFTPEQPPAPYACAGATVIADSSTKQGLIHDCEALLSARDTLRGTASLNWATTLALSSWDGVTTSGAPPRITELDLSSESLSGTIPVSLGNLFELTELDLSNNSLTGAIPEALGWLHNLTTLRLSGNSLTGCIPLALKEVATSDLGSLNLLYCQPYTPEGLTAGTATEFAVPLSWMAVENAAKYQVQYREGRVGQWTEDATQPISVSQTVDGLDCETEYQFRVRAFGNGTLYAPDWSDTSIPVLATTGGCVSPVFEEAAYQWEAPEDGETGEALGTAEATDPNGDSVTYAITAGNGEGNFRIDTATGQVTLARNVASMSGDTYTLTISASDGTNAGTVTATVTIAASPACGAGQAAPSASSDPGLVTDCQALIEARDGLEGDQHVNWSTRRPLAQWQDVTLSGTPQRVTGLDLSGRGLDGTVPASLGRLSALSTLDLGGNSLTGSIPTELGSLTGLTSLDLGSNDLSGDIPTELGSLTNLESLLLNGNGLTGSIPTQLGEITGLEELNLASNMLNGEIPGELAALTGMTDLYLGGNMLTGSLPAWLGSLVNLETLDLDGNGFTGFIPAELELLTSLDSLALAGNSLTGCIPSGLQDTATHDLDQLGLQYCTAGVDAAPEGLTMSLSGGSFSLSWTALAGSARYEVQHRTTAQDSQWESLPEVTSAAAAFSPAGGAACGTTYQFRVRAHGDGLSRAYGWTSYSEVEDLATVRCNQAPSFSMPSFNFSVAENSDTGTVVGTPLATDPDQGETLAYTIIQGNDDSLFTMDGATGQITVAGGLDHESDDSHTLTVRVEDSLGAVATVQVIITVTNVPEGTAPAPTDPRVSLVSGVFTIGWTGSDVAARYRAEYRIEGEAAGWTPLPETTGESATYAPTQEPGCGLVYQFQVRAYGDGVTVLADWGDYSQLVSVATEACNLEPGFVQESYSFTLAETAASGTAVGSVSANDEDANDVLTYAIEGGNEGEAFLVNGATGAITVAGSLNYLTLPSYTLTLSVSDGRGGEDTVTVTVTLESACSNGTVVPIPQDNVGLVADCVILYGVRGVLAGTGSLDWSASAAMSSWEGISLSGTPQRVTRLELAEQGLAGIIPPDLGRLSQLTSLRLEDNSLTGGIPSHLGFLENLENLNLADNELNGEIPVEIGDLASLEILNLADNSLTGVIPDSIGNLTSLVHLELTRNSLTGAIPASIGNLVLLEALRLSSNQLSGDFPTEMGNLWALDELRLRSNNFPGRLPPSFGRLRPTTIYILRNSIHGCMPHGWRDIARAHDLNDAENYWMPDCFNQAPAFGQESYSFTVSESAAVEAAVGTVAATDADGRSVTYSITAGNEAGKFSVDAGGVVALTATLDYEATASYSLTLQAQDDDDATSTVTVTVTVEDVDGA